jgi:hypothetical protein
MKKGSVILAKMFILVSILSLNSPVYAGKVKLGPEEIDENDILSILPEEILAKAMAENLSRRDLCSVQLASRMMYRIASDPIVEKEVDQRAVKRQIDEFLHDSVMIPAVTQEDVTYVMAHVPRTKIVEPMRSIRTPAPAVPIGLFLKVTGHYPDLPNDLNAEKKEQILRDWKQFPDRPATYVTVADEEEFAKELSKITGRNFIVPTEAQVEVMIRGREKQSNQITVSTYHFGEGDDEVKNHAWIGSKPHPLGVREMPEGKDFTNSYGLIHAAGNVYTKSSEGVIRGGAFNCYPWNAESAYRFGGYAGFRYDSVGFRVAEVL